MNKRRKQLLNDSQEMRLYCKLQQGHIIAPYGVLAFKGAVDLS